jgi:NADP-dependent 3-hydroxy acid dehydrogenase YdfG
MKQVIVITGASSGFGELTAQDLLGKGWTCCVRQYARNQWPERPTSRSGK